MNGKVNQEINNCRNYCKYPKLIDTKVSKKKKVPSCDMKTDSCIVASQKFIAKNKSEKMAKK